MPINWGLGLASKNSWELGFLSLKIAGMWDQPIIGWDYKKILNWDWDLGYKINW